MKFELFRMMLQDYTNQQKELSQTSRLDMIDYAYQRIWQEKEDPWTALGDFSNAWFCYAKHLRPNLIKDPLTRPEHETEHTRRWGAFCAASVEYLCELHHQPCPEWVHDPHYILSTPWWYTSRANDPEIRKTTPPSFACRNIFCSNRLYQNKYEMYEWMYEGILKGMTDIHEIQLYARQREISLYGA